jgi:hypothetical protein
MTAHNAAGSRIVTSQVSTLTVLGQTVQPSQLSTPAPATTNTAGVDGSLAISAILAIIIVATALLLSLYCYKRWAGRITSVGMSFYLAHKNRFHNLSVFRLSEPCKMSTMYEAKSNTKKTVDEIMTRAGGPAR